MTSVQIIANPAVTIGRMFSDTFAGIAPGSAPGFIAAQIVGALDRTGADRRPLPGCRRHRRRRRHPAPRPKPTTPINGVRHDRQPRPPGHHHHPDLSIDQQLALRTAATRLHRDFGEHFGVETIERFLHSSYDQFAGRATIPNFLPLLAERFARQRLNALARVEGKITDGKPTVLFLCTHNAGRSQMALGFFNHLAGEQAVAWSGGSEPGNEINPAAVQAMAEVGIDITGEFPKPWTDEIVQAADVVITMGCGDACPIFPGKRYEELGPGRPRRTSPSTRSARSATTSKSGSAGCSPNSSGHPALKIYGHNTAHTPIPVPVSEPILAARHIVAVGGSDAGISAALRARELDPTTEVTVVVADAYPNFSICGIPYYVSGEVPHWRNLAHRTAADLEPPPACGCSPTPTPPASMSPSTPLDILDPDGIPQQLRYDALVVGTGASAPAHPSPDSPAPTRSAPQTGCTCCTPWATPSPCMDSLDRAQPEERGHHRRRLHRPGDGRSA